MCPGRLAGCGVVKMGDISKNFNRSEFACKCGCGFDACDIELIGVLEETRKRFGNRAVRVHSPNRCVKYNATIKGAAKHSKHTKGIACDFSIQGVSPKEIYDYLDSTYKNCYGLGLYSSWVHFDVRKEKARW